MAPNALKARQFIVLLKTTEGDPFLDFFLGKTNPFKNLVEKALNCLANQRIELLRYKTSRYIT